MRTREYTARVDAEDIDDILAWLIRFESGRFTVEDDRGGNGGYVVTAALEDRMLENWREFYNEPKWTEVKGE